MTYSVRLFFIPCEANQFRPRFIESRFLAWIVLVLFLLKIVFISFTFSFPQTSFFAAVNRTTIISLTNQERQSKGLGTLSENSQLNNAASLKAKDMIKNDYFAHTSPGGISPWYWFSNAGYNYQYAGENLAMDFVDSTELYNAWYNSPSHRDNLINPNFKEIGIAIVTGEFEGRETTVVVQLFGTKYGATATAPETTTAPAETSETETSGTTNETTETSETPSHNTTPTETYQSVNEGSLTGYYADMGEPFPSFERRAKLFEKYGLGLVSEYQGTAKQNDMLLGELLEGNKKEKFAEKKKEQSKEEPELTNLEEKLTEKEMALLEDALSREHQEPVFSSTTKIRGVETEKESGFLFSAASLIFSYYESITQKIFLTVLVLVVLSLVIDVFIKIRLQYKNLILRGVFYCFVLFVLFLLDKEIIVQLIPHKLGIL